MEARASEKKEDGRRSREGSPPARNIMRPRLGVRYITVSDLARLHSQAGSSSRDLYQHGFPHNREKFMTGAAEAYIIKNSDLSEFKQKMRKVFCKRQAATVLSLLRLRKYREAIRLRR